MLHVQLDALIYERPFVRSVTVLIHPGSVALSVLGFGGCVWVLRTSTLGWASDATIV